MAAGHYSSAVVQITVVAVDDAPTLKISPASGNEDSAIALDVETALSDLDGSETLTVLIGAIPVGATLSDGINSFTATTGNTSVDVIALDLVGAHGHAAGRQRRRFHPGRDGDQHRNQQRRRSDEQGRPVGHGVSGGRRARH